MKLEAVSEPSLLTRMKYKLIAGAVVLAPLVGTASAAINWTDITDVIDGMATSLIPSFVSLVTAAVPLLITLAVVGFVMNFMDSILGMLNRFK
jgi:uncharacterized membrane protein